MCRSGPERLGGFPSFRCVQHNQPCCIFKKHVVLLISQKDYVTFYILPRLIIGLRGNIMKISIGSAEEGQTHIWLDRQEGKCFGSEVYLKIACRPVALARLGGFP